MKKNKKANEISSESARTYGVKQTGTIIDEYLDLFEQITIFSEELIQFDKDGKKLEEVADDFIRSIPLEEENSASAILLGNWLHLDYRFGHMKETVCERFMKEEVFRMLL